MAEKFIFGERNLTAFFEGKNFIYLVPGVKAVSTPVSDISKISYEETGPDAFVKIYSGDEKTVLASFRVPKEKKSEVMTEKMAAMFLFLKYRA